MKRSFGGSRNDVVDGRYEARSRDWLTMPFTECGLPFLYQSSGIVDCLFGTSVLLVGSTGEQPMSSFVLLPEPIGQLQLAELFRDFLVIVLVDLISISII